MASCKAEAVPCEVVKVRDDARVDMRHAGCGVVVGDKLYLWGGQFHACGPVLFTHHALMSMDSP